MDGKTMWVGESLYWHSTRLQASCSREHAGDILRDRAGVEFENSFRFSTVKYRQKSVVYDHLCIACTALFMPLVLDCLDTSYYRVPMP